MGVALVVGAELTACSHDEAIPEATHTPSPTESRRGGVYRVASPYDAITLDPAVANGMEDRWLCGTLLFNRLYSYDANGKLHPDLALDLPTISPDGLTITIHLRSGVRFHNGREMTADDVKFTLERTLDPTVGSWGLAPLLNIVGADEVVQGKTKTLVGVSLLDPHTVQIKLKKPLAAFPAMLSLSTYGIVPRDEVLAAGAAWGSDIVIGTGPFKLTEWEMGEHIRLTRHENYFHSGLPHLDEVRVSFNIVAPVAMELWKQGEAEFVWFAETTDERLRLRDDATLGPNLRSAPSLTSSRILFNGSNRYARDVRVRRAIASAINRVAVAGEFGFADGVAELLPSLMPQFDSSFESANTFDPARAKQSLADAGYPDGIAGFVIFSRQPVKEIERIRANLLEIGIETQVISGDFETMRNLVQSGDLAIVYVSQRLDYADAYAEFDSYLDCKPEAASLLHPPCDARVSMMIEAAERLPMNDSQRSSIYQDLQRKVINEDVSQVIVKWVQAAGLGRNNVQGDAIHPIYGLPMLESARMVQP